MKRSKKLLLLFCALLVLAGAYTAVTLLTKEEETETALTLFEGSEVTAIKFKDCDLYLEDGVWYSADDKNFPLDQSYPNEMAAALMNIVSQYDVGAGDKAEYGLDDPVNEITFTCDGAEHTVTVGEQNSVNSCYYAVFDNSENISMLSSDMVLCFNYSLYDMVQVAELPDMTDLSALTVKTENGTLSIYCPEDPYEIYYTDAYTWFAVDEDTVTALDDSSVSALTTYLTTLSFTGCADYAPEDLSLYGLDQPQMTVTAAYNDSDGKLQTFTINVGNLANEYYYAQVTGSDMIYKLSAGTYTAFKEAGVSGLESTELFAMYLDDTDSITYELEGVKETITVTHTDGENSYTLNSVTAGETLIEDWFDSINFSCDKVLAESTEPVNSPYITLTFNGVYGEMTMEISEYDINFYLVSFNGQSRHLVNKNFIETFASETLALTAE